MSNYVIFDSLIKGANRAPFDAAKDLLEKLGIKATALTETKNDPGIDAKALNPEAYRAIFEAALTKAGDAAIIALENSSYFGLLDAKKETNSSVEIIDVNDLILSAMLDKEEGSIKHPFNAFNAGIHYGSEGLCQDALSKLLSLAGAKEVKLNRAYHDNGYSTKYVNQDTAFKMAGNIMLDAFDSACDFAIVNDIRSFDMFDTNQKKLTCAVNRDIGLHGGLPVFSISQVLLMAMGEITPEANKTAKHAIKPSFL